jgi:hypothetical protein
LNLLYYKRHRASNRQFSAAIKGRQSGKQKAVSIAHGQNAARSVLAGR